MACGNMTIGSVLSAFFLFFSDKTGKCKDLQELSCNFKLLFIRWMEGCVSSQSEETIL